MFIIFGWRSWGEPVWTGLLLCEQCRNWAIHYGIRVKRFFTLFFLPVLPLGSDTNVICSICLHKRQLGPGEFAQAEKLGRFNYDLAVLARENPEEYEKVVAKHGREAEVPLIGQPPGANARPEEASAVTSLQCTGEPSLAWDQGHGKSLANALGMSAAPSRQQTGVRGEVLPPGTSAFERPDRASAKLFKFPAGLVLKVTKEEQGFYEVPVFGTDRHVYVPMDALSSGEDEAMAS